MELIQNKVAESGLITLNLEQYLIKNIVELDLKSFLFRELILKEKDFRDALLNYNWEEYAQKTVALYCSNDAIIPVWAYMLIATYLQKVEATYYFGTKEEVNTQIAIVRIQQADMTAYTNQRIVVKGCGETPIPNALYTAIMYKLLPVAKSIFYGEPCSTVPIYKQKLKTGL